MNNDSDNIITPSTSGGDTPDKPMDNPAQPVESPVVTMPSPVNEPVAPTGTTPAPTPVVPIAPKSGGKKNVFAMAAIAAFVLLGGGASAYFGNVVPNKPENIWSTALSNTSKGYEKLITYGDEKKDVAGLKADGTYRVETAGVVVDGSFEARGDRKNGLAKLDVGFSGTRMNLEIRSNIAENSKYPDVYVKADGLDALTPVLGAEYGQFASMFEDQWYAIDHTLFDQIEQSATGGMAAETAEAATLTPEETVQVLRAVGKVNKEYLFSTASDKAVLNASNYVGKEKQDDRSAYHYKVAVNKDNLKKYVTALKDELKNTPATKLTSGKSLEEAINFDDLVKSIDEMDSTQTVDVWVDAGTKLIRTVRISDKDNSSNYTDIGLKYTGGDEFPFYISVRGTEGDTKGSADVTLTLNTKEDRLGVQFDMSIEGTNPAKASAMATIQLSNDTVEFTKPEGAKSIMELFGGLFTGFSGGASLEDTSDVNSQLQYFDDSSFGSDFDF